MQDLDVTTRSPDLGEQAASRSDFESCGNHFRFVSKVNALRRAVRLLTILSSVGDTLCREGRRSGLVHRSVCLASSERAYRVEQEISSAGLAVCRVP